MPAVADPMEMLAAGHLSAAAVEVDADLKRALHCAHCARMFESGGSMET